MLTACAVLIVLGLIGFAASAGFSTGLHAGEVAPSEYKRIYRRRSAITGRLSIVACGIGIAVVILTNLPQSWLDDTYGRGEPSAQYLGPSVSGEPETRPDFNQFRVPQEKRKP